MPFLSSSSIVGYSVTFAMPRLLTSSFLVNSNKLLLRNRSMSLVFGFFPETHIELAKKTKEHWRPFYEYNRRIHGLDWS